MTPRTSSRRPGARALVVVGALAAAVGLGACSALGDPSAAAYLDDEVVVTQDDIATVIDELPREVSDGEPPPTQVLTYLAVESTLREVSAESGTGVVSGAAAQQELAALDEEAGREQVTYSEPTLRLMSTLMMIDQLSQDPEAGALAQERLGELGGRLELNPRYGELSEDGGLQILPVEHPWLAGGADS